VPISAGANRIAARAEIRFDLLVLGERCLGEDLHLGVLGERGFGEVLHLLVLLLCYEGGVGAQHRLQELPKPFEAFDDLDELETEGSASRASARRRPSPRLPTTIISALWSVAALVSPAAGSPRRAS
jgi:hypothetical protein